MQLSGACSSESGRAGFYFVEQVGDDFIFRLGPEITFAVFAYGEFAGFVLALTNEQNGVHLFGFSTANAGTDLVSRCVDIGSNTVLSQF